MKTLWRLSNALELQSRYGSSSRWVPAGLPVVVLYDSAPAAVFARMVNAEVPNPWALPRRYALLEVTVPLRHIQVVEPPPQWQSEPGVTRQLGRSWYEQAGSPLLQVLTPSGTLQYLFNTVHPDAEAATIVSRCESPFAEHLGSLRMDLSDGADWLALR